MSNITLYQFEVHDTQNDEMKKMSRWEMRRDHLTKG
jgi:hypothetical protein